MRQHHRIGTGLALLALLAGCVTINVYFPAVAAERAADRIIDDVWGAQHRETPRDEPAETSNTQGAAALPARLAMGVLDFLVPAAQAQETPDLDISSPAIREIVSSLEARHAELKPYYDSGAIGLTQEATVTVRDMAAVPLPERNRLKKLVAEENADRNALYREIAVANDHPEWEDQIRDTFAERWISKARSGWHYQTAAGEWVQK